MANGLTARMTTALSGLPLVKLVECLANPSSERDANQVQAGPLLFKAVELAL
jgi:hypothetical protein